MTSATDDTKAPTVTAPGLAELRTSMIETYGSGPGRDGLAEIFQHHLRAGTQTALADPRVLDVRRQAQLLVDAEMERLRNAALYWVSPAMTALTMAAAPGMPPFRPTAADLPSRHGLIYFATPLLEITEDGAEVLIVEQDGTARPASIAPGSFQIVAASWGPTTMGGHWPEGGTWFTLYTGKESLADFLASNDRGLRLPRQEAEAIWRHMLPVNIDNELVMRAANIHDGPDPWEQEDHRTGLGCCVHVVLTAIRLMATSRAAIHCEQQIQRPARRRAGKACVTRPHEAVRLVDLAAGSSPRAEATDTGDGSPTYSVRWIVSGHFRQQWYPSIGAHRPKYIDSYVKGPADAPLKIGEKVTMWRQPGENVRGGGDG